MSVAFRKPIGILVATVCGAILSSALVGPALAAPLVFTWSPGAVGLSGGDIVSANNYNIADFSSITINQSNGAFTEVGALNVLNFLNNGNTVASPGLGAASVPYAGYSLYLTFSAAGQQGPIPTVTGTSTNGAFSSVDYKIIGTTSASPPLSFSVSNGVVSINDPGTTFVLAYGNLVPDTGFVTLTKTANGFSPQANLNLNFNECAAAGQGGLGYCSADERPFFVAPTNPMLSLQVGNFSATDTVTKLTTSGNNSFLNLQGGAGNLTFQAPVPEPATLALLGAALLGVGVLRRRRR